MSLIPSFFGRSSNVYDPLSLDIWDGFFLSPFTPMPFSLLPFSRLRMSMCSKRISLDSKKEKVNVELEDRKVLQISGERKKEMEEKNDKSLRRFRLPENAKVDAVKAVMENGVLTVTVPKVEAPKPDTENAFKADVPGLKKEEVKVELEDGKVLQISGERKKEMEEKNDKWHRFERSQGRFLRRLRLLRMRRWMG
ncbi:hypothetical protein AMTRI_Chr08g205920 [Amborella trichopoda]